MHSMEGKNAFDPHVFMLPWLALGHAIPFMELAKQLCDRGLTVHLCSTPTILSSLKDKLQQKAYSEIQTVEIHLPTIPGLPSHHESTSSLPSKFMPLLKKALHCCKPQLTTILQILKPDFVFHDFFPHWLPALALDLNIRPIQLVTFGASCYCLCLSLLRPSTTTHQTNSPLSSIKLHGFEVQSIEKMKQSSDEMEPFDKCIQYIERSESFLVIKTVPSVEAKFLNYLTQRIGNKVIPVGTLVPQQAASLPPNRFSEWLESKERCSVIFVSFGSEYFMSNEEVVELALGLELSEHNFIWVIRLLEEEEQGNTERVLPVGFLERVKDRGLVVNGWAPQRAILNHPTTGGFLTHCGWGSICEGLHYGVPFIALPLQLDQPLNSRLVIEELNLGIEIERESDGRFKREKVAQGIKTLMVHEENETFRRRAKEMSGRIKDDDEAGIDELLRKMAEKMQTERKEKEER